MSEPVWIDKDLGKVTPTDEQIQSAANTYLEQVITNPDSPPLDRTLSSSSAATPADITGDLKSALDYRDLTLDKFSNYQPILFKSGYYYTTPAVGETSSEATSSAYIGAKGEVSEGDTVTFKISNTNGDTSNMIACALLDSSNKVISKHRMINGGTITIPQGVSYIVINNRLSLMASGYYAYIGTNIENVVTALMDGNTLYKRGTISGGTQEVPIDLNDYVSAGFYFIPDSQINPETLLNAPDYTDGFATFVVFMNGNSKAQIFITKMHFYWRRGGTSSWYEWQEASNNNVAEQLELIINSCVEKSRNIWLWGDQQTSVGGHTTIKDVSIPAGTYMVSATIFREETRNCRIRFYSGTSADLDNLVGHTYLSADGDRHSSEVTLTGEANLITCLSGLADGEGYSANWTNIQLEDGTVATDYIQPVIAKDYTARQSIETEKRYFGVHDFTFTDTTDNGITYEWQDGNSRCHVYGTASASSVCYLYNDTSKLAWGFKPGDKIGVLYSSTNEHIAFRIKFYRKNGTTWNSSWLSKPGFITVPENAVGMQAYLGVLNGYTVDGYATIPLLYRFHEQGTYIPFKAKKPLYVSFIDDDASNDEFVTKYYHSCKHNGITGSYAVITGHCKDGDTDIDKLLDYEYDGFNMIPHCQEQKNYLTPFSENFDIVRSRENLFTCLREFDELGLKNPQNLWIIPYGVSMEIIQDLAKDLGFEMAFTTISSSINTLLDNNKYTMRRCTLHPAWKITDDTDPDEAGSLAKSKARIDELVASETGGWAIFTTHYNEWSDESWDSTLDSNGYQVGYERFNTLVQYALSKGCEIVSMAKGAAFMRPFYDRNITNG